MRCPLVLLAFALVGTAMLSNGCVQKYAVTGSGPTAKLRFGTNTGDLTRLSRYDVSACPGKPQEQRVASTSESILVPGETSSIQMIGTSGAAENKIREMLIDASQPFVFQVDASRTPTAYSGGYTCKVSGGFSPKAGNEYEISFQNGNGGCQSRIYRLSRGSGGEVVRTLEPTQRYIRVFDLHDFCQWKPVQSGVPDDIRAALEASEGSAPAKASATTSSEGKPGTASGASDTPGSELREALQSDPGTPKLPPATPSAADSAAVPGTSATRPAPIDATAKSNSAIPRTGDRWKYKVIDGKRAVGTMVVEIVEARGKVLRERITREDDKKFLAERSVDVNLDPIRFQEIVTHSGGFQLTEISPYLPGGEELKPNQQWPDMPAMLLITWFGKHKFTMHARVIGKESVRVPAGQFDATLIEASTSENLGSSIVKVTCKYWYAAGVKRSVRMSLLIESSVSALTTNPEIYELMAFEPAK